MPTATGAVHTSNTARAATLIATSLGFGVVQLDVTAVNVAVTSIGQGLGAGIDGLQWVINAYTLALAALILSAGTLADRIGARRLFVAGFILFTAASAVCALAPSLPALVVSRAVQGIGAAALMPCSLSLITHAFTDARARARAIGIWAAGASVALSAGPLVGGVLIDLSGWRAIFLINVPLGLAGVLLTWRHTAETTRTPRSFDYAGQASAVVALGSLSAAIITAGHHGVDDLLDVSAFVIAAVAVLVFATTQARGRSPMVPPALFASRAVTLTTVCGFMINVAFYGLIFVVSLWLQTTRGLDPLSSGVAFLPTTVGVLVGNLTAGRLSRTVGASRAMSTSAAIAAVALAGMLAVDADAPFAEFLAPAVGVGLGLGLLIPTLTSALLGSVEPSRSGLASGILNNARQTGSVVGVAVYGTFVGSTDSGLPTAVAVSLGLAGAVTVAAACSAHPRGPRPPRHQ